jgi:hypothetical protein
LFESTSDEIPELLELDGDADKTDFVSAGLVETAPSALSFSDSFVKLDEPEHEIDDEGEMLVRLTVADSMLRMFVLIALSGSEASLLLNESEVDVEIGGEIALHLFDFEFNSSESKPFF